MSPFILLLAATLTRAEIVERFRASPVTMCDGLVQAWANCPKEMRREYQSSIAGCAADVCRSLYASLKVAPRRFEKPGIVIRIGDVTTNDTTVLVVPSGRPDASRYVKIFVPAPGYADIRAFRIAAARGWSLAVRGTDMDETTAWNAILDSRPETRLQAELEDLSAWRERGVYARGRGDEDYLKLQRRILRPGFASREEVLTFASRLMLYPAYYDMPFLGRYTELEFRDAARLGKDDLLVRIAALQKANELVVWGGGRGERLAAAAFAYSEFLRALARADTEADALEKLLDDADAKLKETLQ